jgi:hypothetical protein
MSDNTTPNEPNEQPEDLNFLKDEDDTQVRPAPRPLSAVFGDMLRKTDAEQAGPPFYDKTLNYLFQRVGKTNKEAANIRAKIGKAEQALEDTLEERATVQTLFIREYNKREVLDPQSGELIPNPFAPVEETEPTAE